MRHAPQATVQPPRSVRTPPGTPTPGDRKCLGAGHPAGGHATPSRGSPPTLDFQGVRVSPRSSRQGSRDPPHEDVHSIAGPRNQPPPQRRTTSPARNTAAQAGPTVQGQPDPPHTETPLGHQAPKPGAPIPPTSQAAGQGPHSSRRSFRLGPGSQAIPPSTALGRDPPRPPWSPRPPGCLPDHLPSPRLV